MKLKVEFTYPSPDRLSTPAARGASLEQTQTSGSGGGDNVLNELQTLRKKYDAVVEYTVHVTAERDTVVAELEELKKEGARDPKKKGGSSPRQGAADSAADRRVMQVLIVIALRSHLRLTFVLRCLGVFVAVAASGRPSVFRSGEVHGRPLCIRLT